jgi:selenocysteine lyase/cysteine desulfurase
MGKGCEVNPQPFSHECSIEQTLAGLVQKDGIQVSTVFSNAQGKFDLKEFEAAIQPTTRLVVVNHASNVLGILAPVPEIAAIARARGVKLLVDASQTMGCVDLHDFEADFIVFTGHKSLYAPPGVGGVAIRCPELVQPLIHGGTGSNSHSLQQPLLGSEKFEPGTLNYLGIAGLEAALEWKAQCSMRVEFQRQMDLLADCEEQLSRQRDFISYGTKCPELKIPLLSFNIASAFPGEVANFLDEHFNVQTRSGLQCAPLIHQSIGTYPYGTIRISLGHGTQKADIDALVEGIHEYCRQRSLRQARNQLRSPFQHA